MSFENTLDFARAKDKSDSLASYRNDFFFPQHEGKNMLYFCGNSLGLQPKSVADSVKIELEDWANLGVEGHLHGRRPWFSYHEMFADGASKLVGAKKEEVVVMNQLTVNQQQTIVRCSRRAGPIAGSEPLAPPSARRAKWAEISASQHSRSRSHSLCKATPGCA